MPVEATDIDQPFDAPEQNADTAEHTDLDVQEPQSPVQSPQSPKKKQGWPAGSKDKQPRRRPVRAEPRPVTRRSAPPRQTKRVQIESASEASESASEVETPRTARHRQYMEHRQHRQDMHQANVNRYTALFDRMLA